jgi:hypothetical protein
MKNRQNWQEDGLRIGGQLLDSTESKALVDEIRLRVKDPQIAGEIEGFLKEDQALSRSTCMSLQLVLSGLMMARPSGGKKRR